MTHDTRHTDSHAPAARRLGLCCSASGCHPESGHDEPRRSETAPVRSPRSRGADRCRIRPAVREERRVPAVSDVCGGDGVRDFGLRVSGRALCLTAALLAGATARAGDTTGTAAGPARTEDPNRSSRTVQAEGAAVPAARAERHSPRSGYPSLGPAGAKNTLIFFTDYQCPVCPRAARELDQLVADFDGTLRVELHHNPLAMHKNAYDAAAAAKAAQRQGKFWEFHEALLKSRSFSRESLIETAAGVGLDRDAFARDFDDPKLRLEVTAEAKQALDASANGTPGFLINGHVEVGWASLPWLEQVIRTHSR